MSRASASTLLEPQPGVPPPQFHHPRRQARSRTRTAPDCGDARPHFWPRPVTHIGHTGLAPWRSALIPAVPPGETRPVPCPYTVHRGKRLCRRGPVASGRPGGSGGFASVTAEHPSTPVTSFSLLPLPPTTQALPLVGPWLVSEAALPLEAPESVGCGRGWPSRGVDVRLGCGRGFPGPRPVGAWRPAARRYVLGWAEPPASFGEGRGGEFRRAHHARPRHGIPLGIRPLT